MPAPPPPGFLWHPPAGRDQTLSRSRGGNPGPRGLQEDMTATSPGKCWGSPRAPLPFSRPVLVNRRNRRYSNRLFRRLDGRGRRACTHSCAILIRVEVRPRSPAAVPRVSSGSSIWQLADLAPFDICGRRPCRCPPMKGAGGEPSRYRLAEERKEASSPPPQAARSGQTPSQMASLDSAAKEGRRKSTMSAIVPVSAPPVHSRPSANSLPARHRPSGPLTCGH